MQQLYGPPGWQHAPVRLVPIALSMIALMAKHLQIVDVERKLRVFLAWLNVVNMNDGASLGACTTALANCAMLFERHHAGCAPCK